MCYSAILPTTSNQINVNDDLSHLIYIFNRWRKMIKNYGRLDPISLTDDFNIIAKVIKSDGIENKIRRIIRLCRDKATKRDDMLSSLYSMLGKALRMICKKHEDQSIIRVKKHYADQGMTERYLPLTKRLKREKIRRLDKELYFTDARCDSPSTTRFVRRIIEKRAAQTVHRIAGRKDFESNRFRQSVRRAASFSLHNAVFIDFDHAKRMHGTHWKVVYYPSKGKRMLKAKKSYDTYEEALAAAQAYHLEHPADQRPMEPYICAHCGKWHIGHTSCYEKPEA